MTEQSGDNITTYQVSELAGALRRSIEDKFGHVRVRGELGRVVRPASGHVYLDLKDEKAVLAGVIWRDRAARLAVQPEQGLEVIVTGRLTTYAPQSRYQIQIDDIQPAGEGALMALLAARHKKLHAEGLFDAARKKPLPLLPCVIGVVTSPSGAVIRDILHRLAERFPRDVLVWPVRVQGESCAAEVAAAIAGFNALSEGGKIARPDLIIVARGGGSLEDLWGFNEEVVVRAAVASAIPLISAIGHETDTSLLDHAADYRAPTPTAAAERAVPVRADLVAHMTVLRGRSIHGVRRLTQHLAVTLTGLRRALPRPDSLYGAAAQRLDIVRTRLRHGLEQYVQARRIAYERRANVISPQSLVRQLEHHGLMLVALRHRFARAMASSTRVRTEQLARAGGKLELLSYDKVLARGFALARLADGRLLRRAADAPPETEIKIRLAEGEVAAKSISKSKKLL